MADQDHDIVIRINAKDLTEMAAKSAQRNLGGLGAGAKEAAQSTSFLGGVAKTAIGTFAGFVSAQTIMRGVSAAFGFAKDAAFGMNATLESTTLQFATLMGDADRAREHVLGLFEFAKRTPFETGPIIEASRMMRTFGGDALDTQANLTILGDAAAATGAPIDQLGFWVGRMFSMLQAGKPFGEAAMRLQELAVLSPKTRAEMEKLQKSGASSAQVFGVFQRDMGKFTGAMEKQAGTWSGVTSTFSDTIKILTANAMQPLFATARDLLGALNNVLGTDTFAQQAERLGHAVSTGVVVAVDLAKRGFEALAGAGQFLLGWWNDLVRIGTSLGAAVGDVGASTSTLAVGWSNLVSFASGLWNILTLNVEILIAVADKLGLLRGISMLVSAVLQAFVGILGAVGDGLGWVADKIRWLLEAVGLLDKNIKPAQTSFRGLSQDTLPALAAETAATTGATSRLNTALGQTPNAALEAGAGLQTLTKEQEKAAEQATQWWKTLQEQQFEAIRVEAETRKKRADELAELDRQALQFMLNDQRAMDAQRLAEADAAAQRYLQRELENYTFLQNAARDHSKTISEINNERGLRQMEKDAAAMKSVWRGLFDGLKGSLGDLNGIFQAAFQGGGGLGGAVKSFATNTVATLTSMIPVVGPIISQFSGAIVAGLSKLGGLFGFGKSEGRKQLDEANAQIKTLQDDLLKTHGSLENIAAAGGAAGEALVAAWGSQNREGLQWFKQLLGEFNEELKEQEATAKKTASEQARATEDMARRARGSFADLTGTVEILQAKLRNTDALQTLSSELTKASKGGVFDLQAILREVEALTGSLGTSQPAVQVLQDAIAHAALTGVFDFETMSAAILALKDQMAVPIVIPVTLDIDRRTLDAMGQRGTGRDTSGRTYLTPSEAREAGVPWKPKSDFPGAYSDAAYRDYRTEDQSEINRQREEGFQHGTRALDFEPFGRGMFARLHGDEAVIPRGSGHQLAAEIAAAMGGARGERIEVRVVTELNGRVLAEELVPVLPGALKRRGFRL